MPRTHSAVSLSTAARKRARRNGPPTCAGRLVRFAIALALSAGCGEFVATMAAAQHNVGISSVRAQRWGREGLPNANVDGNDRFAFAFAVGDFNGDGADDLASGAPTSDGANATPVDQCGQVVVRYGIAGAGLDEVTAPIALGQFTVGAPNPAEAADIFGRALAACDLDDDGFDDLAVGVPLEDLTLGGLTNIVDSGVVEIYYGTSVGLSAPASAVLSSNSIQSSSQKLGWALACDDFDGDGFDDLAVGLPGRIVGELSGAGRIRVYPGSLAGVGAGAYALDQDSTEMAGVAEAGDAFGTQLAVGDFDGDFHADLAIGVPMEILGAGDPVGAVQIVYGSAGGLTGSGDQIVVNPDIEGDLDEGSFGQALAAVNLDGDPFDDLAIGSPGDDAEVQAGGAVYLLFGSPVGVGAIVGELTAELLFGIGESEPLDGFGYALAVGDFDGDGVDDLAMGSPGEDVLGNADGAVAILTGSDGRSSIRVRQIHHGLEGFPGSASEHDLQFGQSLAAGDFDGNGHADLAVGAPVEVESLLPGVGTATILYGALFADGFEDGAATYWSGPLPHP